eukprot:scaffold1621_cov350-Prasinococcus_capsulatus_cf.AAC.21
MSASQGRVPCSDVVGARAASGRDPSAAAAKARVPPGERRTGHPLQQPSLPELAWSWRGDATYVARVAQLVSRPSGGFTAFIVTILRPDGSWLAAVAVLGGRLPRERGEPAPAVGRRFAGQGGHSHLVADSWLFASIHPRRPPVPPREGVLSPNNGVGSHYATHRSELVPRSQVGIYKRSGSAARYPDHPPTEASARCGHCQLRPQFTHRHLQFDPYKK